MIVNLEHEIERMDKVLVEESTEIDRLNEIANILDR